MAPFGRRNSAPARAWWRPAAKPSSASGSNHPAGAGPQPAPKIFSRCAAPCSAIAGKNAGIKSTSPINFELRSPHNRPPVVTNSSHTRAAGAQLSLLHALRFPAPARRAKDNCPALECWVRCGARPSPGRDGRNFARPAAVVPAGTFRLTDRQPSTQVLGNSQSSLRDCANAH